MITKFSDLQTLPFNSDNDLIKLESILSALPSTPFYIAEEFYQNFGRWEIHQYEYGKLEIGQIKWLNQYIRANEIQASFILPRFSDQVTDASKRLRKFLDQGWSCIDDRDDVVKCWQIHKTWLKPPIFIQRRLLGNGNEKGIHLLEGHTRVGILKGCLENLQISENSVHKIWIGC
jgi:hypothetical protein